MNTYFALLVNRASVAAPAALEKAATAASTVTPIVTQTEPAKALVNTCQEPLATAILHAVQIVLLGADYHCDPAQYSLGVSLLNTFQALTALILTLLVLEVGIAYNNKGMTFYLRLAGTFSASLIACGLLWGTVGIFVAFATLIGGFLFWAICSEWIFIPGIIQGLKYLQDSFYTSIPKVFTFLKGKFTDLIDWIKSVIPTKGGKEESSEEPPTE